SIIHFVSVEASTRSLLVAYKTLLRSNYFSKLQQGGVCLDLEFDLTPDIMLKSISSYRKIDFAAGVDLDNSPLPILQTSFTVDQRSESTRLNSSHVKISYSVFCLKK